MQAATRGDGSTGEDVTHNAGVIDGLPQTLQSGSNGQGAIPPVVEVRGEVYITKQDLEQVAVG